jgi:excisionase family DNA binding protein
MTGEIDQNESWLTISDAARRLGIHPTTLRRWADEGQIPVMFTAGGHRRFSTSGIERLRKERTRLRAVYKLEERWAEQALSRARERVIAHQEMKWLAGFDESDREKKRLLGRRLLELMLQYISSSQGGQEIIDEARRIGYEHAQNTLGLGMSFKDALQAAIFFRDTMMEVAIDLPETANVRAGANTTFLRRINELMNTFQLAIAEVYDQGVR